MLPDDLTGYDLDRFWSHVDRSGGPDACWPWTGPSLRAGPGVFRIAGRKLYAARVAHELAVGPVPAGAQVRHSCPHSPDQVRCCNPDHLYLRLP